MNISEKSLNRDYVSQDYKTAEIKSMREYHRGNNKYSEQYIFANQKEDALNITDKFYNNRTLRVISVLKRTKVGCDGLMIELLKNITTHPDDEFILMLENVFIITGMSNKQWEDEMKDKIPNCFKDNIYHHGKLQNLEEKMTNIKNAFIIIDEIDTGDKEDQKLHNFLDNSGILDIDYMEENNIRFIVVSATIRNELLDLEKWCDKHLEYKMTIPENYIGHGQFLEKGIIQEFYPVDNIEQARKWVNEDIIENYQNDYRIHFIRTIDKHTSFIRNACLERGIDFRNHTSSDRISPEELKDIFENIHSHVVIAVKGFYRRANLIPNDWKIKIGVMHERYVANIDTNVQIQGLPGRMTGYWKNIIDQGHKVGPIRTSIKSVKQYEKFYENPNSNERYNTSGGTSFLNPNNINGLEYHDNTIPRHIYIIKNTFDDCKQVGIDLNIWPRGPQLRSFEKNKNENGFYKTNISGNILVRSIEQLLQNVNSTSGMGAGGWVIRPGYRDLSNIESLQWMLVYKNPEYI